MEKIDKRLISGASVIEPKTLEQARRTASMPFVYPHLALMPDAADLVEVRHAPRQLVNVKGD